MMLSWDTETTGLVLHSSADLSKQPRITEFAGALLSLETGEIVDTFTTLINPEMPLPKEIIDLTGITDAMLADQPTLAEALPKISAFFARATTMIAHNLAFDEAMLTNEMRRIDFDPAHFSWPRGKLCTVGLYRDEYGYMPKMSELYEDKMGHARDRTNAHRAMHDVFAHVEIIQKEELWRF
jgi:DNA polymerase III epsilon subunit-like protein